MKSEAKKKNKLNFSIKVCICTVFVLLIIMAVKMNININSRKDELMKMQDEFSRRSLAIEQIKSDIQKLPENIEELDEETLKKIASEELNLRESDIIIFANSQPN